MDSMLSISRVVRQVLLEFVSCRLVALLASRFLGGPASSSGVGSLFAGSGAEAAELEAAVEADAALAPALGRTPADEPSAAGRDDQGGTGRASFGILGIGVSASHPLLRPRPRARLRIAFRASFPVGRSIPRGIGSLRAVRRAPAAASPAAGSGFAFRSHIRPA